MSDPTIPRPTDDPTTADDGLNADVGNPNHDRAHLADMPPAQVREPEEQ